MTFQAAFYGSIVNIFSNWDWHWMTYAYCIFIYETFKHVGASFPHSVTDISVTDVVLFPLSWHSEKGSNVRIKKAVWWSYHVSCHSHTKNARWLSVHMQYAFIKALWWTTIFLHCGNRKPRNVHDHILTNTSDCERQWDTWACKCNFSVLFMTIIRAEYIYL